MCFLLFQSRSVFFFKQKTAYEMRISDWSSDVCSSDLTDIGRTPKCAGHLIAFAHRHAQPLEAVAPAAHNANNAIDDPRRVRRQQAEPPGAGQGIVQACQPALRSDRKSTRLNSSH